MSAINNSKQLTWTHTHVHLTPPPTAMDTHSIAKRMGLMNSHDVYVQVVQIQLNSIPLLFIYILIAVN